MKELGELCFSLRFARGLQTVSAVGVDVSSIVDFNIVYIPARN
jgi:hypothetical protein